MSNYVLIYYGEPKFGSREDGASYMAQWRAWVGGLGNAMVNRGIPLKKSKTVSSSGVSDGAAGVATRLTGFSVVEADSMDAAIEMAKKCPHLQHGTVDVAEAMDMGR